MSAAVAYKPSLMVMARINVIHKIVSDLVKALEVKNEHLVQATLHKGIVEKQLIEKLSIFFLQNEDQTKKVGELIIYIDWETYRIKLFCGDKVYQFNRDKSISEQLDFAIPLFKKLMVDFKTVLSVNEVTVWYLLRDLHSQEDNRNAHKYCGVNYKSGKKSPSWAFPPGQMGYRVHLSSDNLPELKFTSKFYAPSEILNGKLQEAIGRYEDFHHNIESVLKRAAWLYS